MQKAKKFLYQHKIVNNISQFILYPEKLFFINTKYSIIFYFYICTRQNKIFVSTQNTQQYFTIYIIPSKNFFLLIQNYKILNNIVLLYIHERKILFINTKHSIIFHYLYYTQKIFFFINTKYSIILYFYICTREKLFFYQHKILNNI